MLEIIQKAVIELNDSDKDFYTYFNEYVVDVHNHNIFQEIRYMRSHNTVNPLMVDREINSCIEELRELW